MNEKLENSGNSVNFNVSSGKDSTVVNGAYQNSGHQSTMTTTQNFWLSMSIIGTISIGTLIGTASLVFYLSQKQAPIPTDSSPQTTSIENNSQNQ